MSQPERNAQNSKPATPLRAQQDVSSLVTKLTKLMAYATAMCFKQSLTKAQAEIHMQEWKLIADEVGFEKLADAVREVLRNDSDFFPSIRAIRRRAGLNTDDLLAIEMDHAWEEAGTWASDPFDAPIPSDRTRYAIHQVGGGVAIIGTDFKAMPILRKDFEKAYRRAVLLEGRGQLQSWEELLEMVKGSSSARPEPQVRR